MDFARRQLEKYGWTDGKGLGKNETGISEALKPKLKRSVTGIGHDPASEYNEHWWTTLYNKAADNIEVKVKKNKAKKFKTNNTNFEITNSTWKLNNNGEKSEEQYSDYFIKTAVLTKGGSKMEIVREDTEIVNEEKKDVLMMTDEELFKACGGRTAHKGARHGLKALGKLARIQQQEENLLNQPQFKGYSHYKKMNADVVENISLNSEETINKDKKKIKKKKCFKDIYLIAESPVTEDNDNCDLQSQTEKQSKSKRKNKTKSVNMHQNNIKKSGSDNSTENIQQIEGNDERLETQTIDKPKKKRKGNYEQITEMEEDNFDTNDLVIVKKKKNKKPK